MKNAYSFLWVLVLTPLVGLSLGSVIAQDTTPPFSFQHAEYVLNGVAAGGHEKIEIETTNNQAFTPDSRPEISYTSFKLDNDNNPVLVEADDSSKWLATDWINGPVSLNNLADGASNLIELTVIVPETAGDGAYRGAVSVTHADWQQPINTWVVINVGSSQTDLQIVEPDDGTFLNFEDNDVSVVVINESDHYLNPQVKLVLRSGSDGDPQEFELASDNSIGLLPTEQQIFVPVQETVSFDSEIVESSDRVVHVVFTDGDDKEIARLAFPGLEVNNDDDAGDDSNANGGGDEDDSTDSSVVEDSSGNEATKDEGFLETYLDLIIIIGAALVGLLLVWLLVLTVRHRGTRMPPGSQYKPQVISGPSGDGDASGSDTVVPSEKSKDDLAPDTLSLTDSNPPIDDSPASDSSQVATEEQAAQVINNELSNKSHQEPVTTPTDPQPPVSNLTTPEAVEQVAPTVEPSTNVTSQPLPPSPQPVVAPSPQQAQPVVPDTPPTPPPNGVDTSPPQPQPSPQTRQPPTPPPGRRP